MKDVAAAVLRQYGAARFVSQSGQLNFLTRKEKSSETRNNWYYYVGDDV